MGNEYVIEAYYADEDRERRNISHRVLIKGSSIPLGENEGPTNTLKAAYAELATEDLLSSPHNLLGICEIGEI